MIRAIVQVVLNGVAVLLIAKIVPGITYQGDWMYLLLVGLVLGILNLFVRPIVTILSLPFIIVTLGLFFFAINGLMIYFAAALLDGLTVDGCFPALMGGVVLAFFNWIIRAFSEN